ncbi:Quinoprotein amine dehydrogenase, beta chain-like [Sesbania bispinosa]|nr:Quinoprotein amine dehydrogenase, beta chain-like [Sesbania bispinosa]
MVGNNGNDDRREEEVFPYDVLINILKRVPVKSLIRFKCVSKDWWNLIESPYFTAQHLHYSSENNLCLLLQRILPPREPYRPIAPSSSCLIAPDLNVHNPPQFAPPTGRVIGSCNGLLCVSDDTDHCLKFLSLWNPATRQVRKVPPETLIDVRNYFYFGFGFSPVVNDYKIVRISVSDGYVGDTRIVDLGKVRVNCAAVYSLKTGSWKEIDSTNLRNMSLRSGYVTANGAMFWEATMTPDSDTRSEFVVSFDIGDEVFTKLKGPPSPPVTCTHPYSNMLAVHDDKLAVFRLFIIGVFDACSIDLWVLEGTHTCASGGDSWVKKYSLGPFSKILYPLSLWRDIIVCREELAGHIDEFGGVKTVLSLFNPYTNELINLPAQSVEYYYVPSNYAESLVPLDNIHHA